MKKILFKASIITSVALSGCATQSVNTFQPFEAGHLSRLVQSGHLKQKVDTFFVINDSSSSMSNTYESNTFPGYSKLSVEKELLERMNKTIPDDVVTLSSGLRSFGFGSCLSWGFSHLNQEVQAYSSASFEQAINSLTCSSGGTPVAASFDAVSNDLTNTSGQIAVILFSDGHQYDTSPARNVQLLKQQYADKLCLYTVWVGNEKEHAGQAILEELSSLSGCGFSTTAAKISSRSGMARFVANVFFETSTPVAIPAPIIRDGDADGDGVLDSKDKCPNTPRGAIVDKDGCWAFHGVLFEFDKATIKPEYKQLFNNAIKVLKLNPSLTVEIQGHTDSMGTDRYNQDLSERRAISVKQYLVAHGISPSRLTTRGFGESAPVASNETEAGRSHNRRVFYKRTDM